LSMDHIFKDGRKKKWKTGEGPISDLVSREKGINGEKKSFTKKVAQTGKKRKRLAAVLGMKKKVKHVVERKKEETQTKRGREKDSD